MSDGTHQRISALLNAISTKFSSLCNVGTTGIGKTATLTCLLLTGAAGAAGPGPSAVDGRSVYRFYCYQCHGYAGNAKTLSSTYLNPKPRDFTAESLDSLPIDRMLDAVRNGRPGTAMMSFDSVLVEKQIEAVVWYIRDQLLENPGAGEKYHSPENGWQNFERYGAAFPFITGELSLDIPQDELEATQRAGRTLYVSACVSCHDQPNTGSGSAIWETRAVSFPRRHYSHRAPPLDVVSGASPYARHDVAVVPENMTEQQSRGMQLYQANCAFCHAPDGTGRNWIGSFLQPKPRDFTAANFLLHDAPDTFREIVRSGIPNSSMPAWQHVLTDDEIDATVSYINIAFRNRAKTSEGDK